MADQSSWRPNLPTPMILGTSLIGGGGGLYVLSQFLPPGALWILCIGMAVVGLLVCLYVGLVRWRDRRKSSVLEDGITRDGHVPRGLGAGEQAAHDDMQKKFKEAMKKLGKIRLRVGELPWYVIIGESGSGKTEAVRHCGIRWPDGFNEPQQGFGGTINMDWWFCKHAVILDTAGKLIFPEVQAGQSGGWREFLRLLKTNRTNCPINGMILAIPADSLLQDSAETIERKSGKIAEQLELLKSELDVRFPVYLVITKSDKICGFREFFENVRDPKMVHQILGWSNPQELDRPHAPEKLEDHFQSLFRQLQRRRLGLLAASGNGPDASPKRIGEVDALYAFPQAMSILVSNLKLYLETIFAGDEMMGKPLFLRGVYFTSAMQEGADVDAELVKAGVPIESIRPDPRIWDSGVSRFLRDLLLEKVFREAGLVTRAGNARSQHRRRKLAVLGAGMASVIALMAFTLYGWFSLRESVGKHRDLWEEAAAGRGSGNYWRPVIEGEGGDRRRADPNSGVLWLQKAWKLKEERIRVPWVFSLVHIGGGLDVDRARALDVMFERCVTLPLAEAAGDVMRNETFETASAATRPSDRGGDPNSFIPALVELIRLEAAKRNPADAGLPSGSIDPLRLAPLFRYVIREANSPRPDADELQRMLADLQRTLRRLRLRDEKGRPWPSWAFAQNVYCAPAQRAMENGVDLLARRAWNVEGAGVRDANGKFDEAVAARNAFHVAEADLLGLEESFQRARSKPDLDKAPMDRADYDWVAREWKTRYDAIQKADGGLVGAIAALRSVLLSGGADGNGLEAAIRDEGARKLGEIERLYGLLKKASGIQNGQPPEGDANDFLYQLYVRMDGNQAYWRRQVDDQVKRELVELGKRKGEFLAWSEANAPLYYGSRLAMYRAADGQVRRTDSASQPSSQGSDANALWTLLPALATIDADANVALDSLATRAGPASTPTTNPDVQAHTAQDANARRLCEVVIRRSASYRRCWVLEEVLRASPTESKGWGDLIASRCKAPVKLPPVLFLSLDPAEVLRNDPSETSVLLAAWQPVRRISWQDALEGPRLEAAYNKARESIEEYQLRYVKFWGGWVLDPPLDPNLRDWPACQKELARAKTKLLHEEDLKGLAQGVEKAIAAVRPFADPNRLSALADAGEAVRGGYEILGNPKEPFWTGLEEAIAIWKDLSVDHAAARKVLMGKSAEKAYYPAMRKNAGYMRNYWAAVLGKCTETLAGGYEADVRKQIATVKLLAVFPLIRDGQGNMTAEGMAAVERQIGEALAKGSPERGTIGAGDQTELSQIDPWLRRLRDPAVAADEKTWLETMQTVARVLQKGVAVEGSGTVEYKLRNVCMVVDGNAGKWEEIGSSVLNLGKLGCESGLVLEFKREVGDANATGFVKLQSPWTCVHLLLDPRARKDPNDPKRWSVEVPITDAAGVLMKDDNGKPRTYTLQMTFSDRLPDPSTWPAAKPGGNPAVIPAAKP